MAAVTERDVLDATSSTAGVLASLAPSSRAGGVEPIVVESPRDGARLVGPDGRGRARLVLDDQTEWRILLVDPAVPPPVKRPGIRRREVVVDGWRVEVDLEPARLAALRARATRGREAVARGGPTEVHAIIPGRVVGVAVVSGDDVVAGQQLLVIEAMKMQNELRAPRDGRIDRVAVAAGQTIEVGDLLLVLA